MENQLKFPKDFAVEECVTHYYQKDGRWYWYCVTDDTGSGKRRIHLKGHTRPGDASVGAKYHRNAKHQYRQHRAYMAWWMRSLLTTSDVDFFIALWQQQNHNIGSHMEPEDLMASVQSDNYLWESMVKLNDQINNTGQ